MNKELLWYHISLNSQDSFNEFLNIYKTYVKQIQERKGDNAIYFPAKSFVNDYSKVFISVCHTEYNSFKELLLIYKAIQLTERPVDEISIVYSDKDVPFFEDDEARFM